jgi:deferrochelatase/peroxidase EfeB
LLSRPFSGWTLDGSFLVFRKLKQFVPEFNQYLTANAVQNAAGTLTVQQGAELLGARLLGRWRSGAPIDLSPTQDDPSQWTIADPRKQC